MSDNLYAPPEADPAELTLAERLLNEQSMPGVIVGALSAGIPSVILYALIVAMYSHPLIAFVLPGILIGYTVRFCGRAIEWRLRLVSGLITLILLLFINYLLTYPSGMILSLPSVALATILAKRNLDPTEQSALDRYLVLGK